MKPQSKPSPRSSRRFVRRAASLLAALVVGGAAAVSVGVRSYDVGAVAPHSAPVEWASRHAMETSVRAHAKGILIPAGTDLQDPKLAERAIGHYSVACAQCHAAPGHRAAPWMVLYPAPADLTRPEVVARWSDTELYWIIKNGIKDTGMIALGPTHQEHDLWAVSAFVRQLPEMSSERYHQLVTEYRAQRATMAAASAHPH
jgi:mono/diheme cytochrome c family protein